MPRIAPFPFLQNTGRYWMSSCPRDEAHSQSQPDWQYFRKERPSPEILRLVPACHAYRDAQSMGKSLPAPNCLKPRDGYCCFLSELGRLFLSQRVPLLEILGKVCVGCPHSLDGLSSCPYLHTTMLHSRLSSPPRQCTRR